MVLWLVHYWVDNLALPTVPLTVSCSARTKVLHLEMHSGGLSAHRLEQHLDGPWVLQWGMHLGYQSVRLLDQQLVARSDHHLDSPTVVSLDLR